MTSSSDGYDYLHRIATEVATAWLVQRGITDKRPTPKHLVAFCEQQQPHQQRSHLPEAQAQKAPTEKGQTDAEHEHVDGDQAANRYALLAKQNQEWHEKVQLTIDEARQIAQEARNT